MTPQKLETLAAERYSPKDWRPRFARDYGVSDRTLRAWLAGAPIPKWVGVSLRDAIDLRTMVVAKHMRKKAPARH